MGLLFLTCLYYTIKSRRKKLLFCHNQPAHFDKKCKNPARGAYVVRPVGRVRIPYLIRARKDQTKGCSTLMTQKQLG